LGVVLVLNAALVAALVAVGVSAHSVAVLAEGLDYLADAAAIGMTLLAMRVEAEFWLKGPNRCTSRKAPPWTAPTSITLKNGHIVFAEAICSDSPAGRERDDTAGRREAAARHRRD